MTEYGNSCNKLPCVRKTLLWLDFIKVDKGWYPRKFIQGHNNEVLESWSKTRTI